MAGASPGTDFGKKIHPEPRNPMRVSEHLTASLGHKINQRVRCLSLAKYR